MTAFFAAWSCLGKQSARRCFLAVEVGATGITFATICAAYGGKTRTEPAPKPETSSASTAHLRTGSTRPLAALRQG